MEKGKQATDIDRKLAIYYHPLFQEVIKNALLLFNLPPASTFEIGLLQFVQFNLKLQKSLLPTFEIENALVSALNDWVKQVAQCLTYEGMVSTSQCEQITSENFSSLLQKELDSIYIAPFAPREQYFRILTKMASHDAFKLLGVKINKEVFNKFVFDLCSTWCEFLDIELFTYFLVAIYIQISEGATLTQAKFKSTSNIAAIDLEFMEEFEQIKAVYNKNRKKELRYYRAWCQWNYLRINQIGQALILQLDQIHENEPRVLQLALIFQKSIQVINDEITNQSIQKQELPSPQPQAPQREGDFLVAKKISVPTDKEKRQPEPTREIVNIQEFQPQPEEEAIHNFEIQIDAEGNMFLKKIVRLPIIGTKIEPEPAQRKEALKQLYLQRKKEQIRQISNLYRRMQNMKVRLEHNSKNDPYTFKESAKVAEREQFYMQQEGNKPKYDYTNRPVDKIIHGKLQPEQTRQQSVQLSDYRTNFKQELMEEKQPIRKNDDYIHKVMAPSFVTDQKNNMAFSKKQGSIYGIGPNAERRDLKIGLPRLKYMQRKMPAASSYHIVGKLTRDRAIVNERIKSFSTYQQPLNKLQKEKEEYRHIWTRYITQQQMQELNNYEAFYSKLAQAKQQFAQEYQSSYRLNLKKILLYDNKRYEMGGAIDRKQEEHFYERIRKLIKRDSRRQQRRKRKTKLREYRKAVGKKDKRRLFEDIFISYHRSVIREIKEERKNASMAK